MRPFLMAFFVCSLCAAGAHAQDARARARTLLATAQQQHEAEQFAEAAHTYLEAYELLRSIGNDRASLALWNAGESLSHVPGREREARDTLMRFIDESHGLTSDEGVRDDRSHAQELIAQLEARIGPSGGGISPVGPVITAVGGAALIVGAVLGGLALVRQDELAAICGGTECANTPENRAMNHEIHLFAGAADALLFGGAAVAAVGIVLIFALTEGGSSERARALFRNGSLAWRF